MSEEEARDFLGLGPKEPTDTFRIDAPIRRRWQNRQRKPAAAQAVADAGCRNAD